MSKGKRSLSENNLVATINRNNNNTIAQVDSSIFSSKWLLERQVKELEEETGLKCRKGKFSESESNTLRQLVDDYLREHGIEKSHFINLLVDRKRKARAEMHDFFISMAQKLNNGRPVISVYNRLRRMYHSGNHGGKWTVDEDERLRRLITIYGPAWETISKEMNRLAINCRDRYRLIKKDYSKGKWTQNEEEQLLSIIEQVKRESLTDEPSSTSVSFWNTVSERMGSRSQLGCILKWIECSSFKLKQSQFQMESSLTLQRPYVKWNDVEDYKLLKAIYDLGLEDDTEINWRSLMEGDLEKWSPQRLRLRWKLLKRRIRSSEEMDLDSIIKELLRRLLEKNPQLLEEMRRTEDGEKV